MFEILGHIFVAALLITPVIAVLCLLAALCDRDLRTGILPALICALLGFGAAMILSGGAPDSAIMRDPGVLIAVVIGIPGAGAGFILGLGGYCMATKEKKKMGGFILFIGLALIISLLGSLGLRTKIIADDRAWWRMVYTTEITPEMEKEAASHLSPPVRSEIQNGLQYATPGQISPSVIKLMYHGGIRIYS